LFDIKFELVCQGFHQGAITSMDVALQRPIIITSSQTDRTIRVWNYLTGHCEYCKIILTEKDDQEKEMDILSVAIHPNGYYIAVSDREMIRFFHLCYKELRFYNNDAVGNDNPKSACYLLKFSHGGHLLAAVSGKVLYIIRAFTRETLKVFKTNHAGQIKSIVFHESDFFIYSVGNDGMIVEYDLTQYTMY
jgi:WD40 repeat protein